MSNNSERICTKGRICGVLQDDPCNGAQRPLTEMEGLMYGEETGTWLCQRHRGRLKTASEKLGCSCPAYGWEHSKQNHQSLLPCPERLIRLFHGMQPDFQLSGRICHTCREKVDTESVFINHPAYLPPKKRKPRVTVDPCLIDASAGSHAKKPCVRGERTLQNGSCQTDDIEVDRALQMLDLNSGMLKLSNALPCYKATQTHALHYIQSLPLAYNLSEINFDPQKDVETIITPENVVLFNGQPAVLGYNAHRNDVCVLLLNRESFLYQLIIQQYPSGSVPTGLSNISKQGIRASADKSKVPRKVGKKRWTYKSDKPFHIQFDPRPQVIKPIANPGQSLLNGSSFARPTTSVTDENIAQSMRTIQVHDAVDQGEIVCDVIETPSSLPAEECHTVECHDQINNMQVISQSDATGMTSIALPSPRQPQSQEIPEQVSAVMTITEDENMQTVQPGENPVFVLGDSGDLVGSETPVGQQVNECFQSIPGRKDFVLTTLNSGEVALCKAIEKPKEGSPVYTVVALGKPEDPRNPYSHSSNNSSVDCRDGLSLEKGSEILVTDNEQTTTSQDITCQSGIVKHESQVRSGTTAIGEISQVVTETVENVIEMPANNATTSIDDHFDNSYITQDKTVCEAQIVSAEQIESFNVPNVEKEEFISIPAEEIGVSVSDVQHKEMNSAKTGTPYSGNDKDPSVNNTPENDSQANPATDRVSEVEVAKTELRRSERQSKKRGQKQVSILKHQGYYLSPPKNFEPDKCIVCGYTSPNLREMSEHLKSHPGVLKCSYCDYACVVVSDMVKHVESGHVRYECLQCERHFTTLSALAKHQDTHIIETCQLCDFTGNKISLRKHIRQQHETSNAFSTVYACEVCGFQTANTDTLLSHMQQQHGVAIQNDIDWQNLLNVAKDIALGEG